MRRYYITRKYRLRRDSQLGLPTFPIIFKSSEIIPVVEILMTAVTSKLVVNLFQKKSRFLLIGALNIHDVPFVRWTRGVISEHKGCAELSK